MDVVKNKMKRLLGKARANKNRVWSLAENRVKVGLPVALLKA
jgi:hypothetical protein